jgi:hypothetical protein
MLAQGWAIFEGEPKLVVELPREPTLLPPDVRSAIGAFEGLVCAEPGDIHVAILREIVSSVEGAACPDCMAETGWDDFQWKLFVAGMTSSHEAA